jgi:transposase
VSASPPQPVPPHLDPDSVAIIAALQQQIDAQQKQLAAQRSELNYAQLKIQVLEERLRKQKIEKYGKASEKLSDLQLELLDHEPAVSSDEIESEAAGGPLPGAEQTTEREPRHKNRKHPGRNELPAHLERVEQIVACAAEQCKCGKCGAETRVIGYEETEMLGMKPAEYFVRACARCIEHGVATAPTPERIATKSIFADETTVEFIVRKYCDSVPLYRQRAILMRDLGIDVALTTINDAVLRVGELLIPIVDAMKRDLLAGSYIQADETYVAVQTQDKKGENHRAFFWQYSAPAKGVVFDFEMTRCKKVAKEFFKDYGGILHTYGYVAVRREVDSTIVRHGGFMQ